MEKLLMKGAPILSTLLAVIVTAVALALPRVSAGPALADDQTVTLAVEKMYCAACPLRKDGDRESHRRQRREG
jgi:hypothetical protein